jgi:glycosidase
VIAVPAGFPLLYLWNPRVVIPELAPHGPLRTFDDLPDEFLDRAAELGFSWLWPVGVWQTGNLGLALAKAPEMLARYRADLPDVEPDDVGGSPFAVAAYDVARVLGGDAALARLRERMWRRGLRLMLDFVPNHVAIDHPWVTAHPEYFIAGDETDLAGQPEAWTRVETHLGPRILAHGRDPYFPPWRDTLQLNHAHAGLRAALAAELRRVAGRCDGVRCDMAMLLEPDVFARTWGDRARPIDGTAPATDSFWPSAVAAVRVHQPSFVFAAEVYWNLDTRLVGHGFDFTYDKTLTDRLQHADARAVRGHLGSAAVVAGHGVHFLENHDEPRAAAAFPPERHRAAAVIAFAVPGMRLIQEGELEGRRARVPIQLTRRAKEAPDPAWRAFYDSLLAFLSRPELREGSWRMGEAQPGSPGPAEDAVVFTWDGGADRQLIVAVNFGARRSRFAARVPRLALDARPWRVETAFADTGEAEPAAVGTSATQIELELPPWGFRALALTPA